MAATRCLKSVCMNFTIELLHEQSHWHYIYKIKINLGYTFFKINKFILKITITYIGYEENKKIMLIPHQLLNLDIFKETLAKLVKKEFKNKLSELDWI